MAFPLFAGYHATALKTTWHRGGSKKSEKSALVMVKCRDEKQQLELLARFKEGGADLRGAAGLSVLSPARRSGYAEPWRALIKVEALEEFRDLLE
jgi:hypothetical protein